jgi:hypothetical protein
MSLSHRLVLVGLLALGVSAAGACSTNQSGVKNYAGEFRGLVDASPDRVTAAARDTLEDLRLKVTSSDATRVDGHVVAYTAQDKKVNVDIKSSGESASQVEIRVGAFGDQALSLRIFDGIRSRLGDVGARDATSAATAPAPR